MKNRKIILASSSPRRKRILKLAGIRFKTIKTNINEGLLIKRFKNKGLENLAKILSFSKAISVVEACHGKPLQRNGIIAGFDTVVAWKNKIIDKPKNKRDALRKILFLSNKEHKVFTGICLIDLRKQKILIDHDVTKVLMKRISRREALNYIKTSEPFGKAGAYAIQGRGSKFVKKISGDYFNIVGLPLKKFVSMLNAL